MTFDSDIDIDRWHCLAMWH